MMFEEYEGLNSSFGEACRKADEKLRKAKAHNDSTVRVTPEPGHNYPSIDGVEVVRTPVFPGRDEPGRAPERRPLHRKAAERTLPDCALPSRLSWISPPWWHWRRRGSSCRGTAHPPRRSYSR